MEFQEDRETRKMLQKNKKKKTKTITNDEGEEVEVTDEEADAVSLKCVFEEFRCRTYWNIYRFLAVIFSAQKQG